jgi:hypothetical protein
MTHCQKLTQPQILMTRRAGVRVWSYNPPGGMVTMNLSAALQGFVTAVVVGKDIISRTGTVTFERMLDQVIAQPPLALTLLG